jgi:hypothetical protein
MANNTLRIPPAAQGFGMANEAFIGNLIPGLANTAIGTITRGLTRPGVGGLVGGVAAGAIVDFLLTNLVNKKS